MCFHCRKKLYRIVIVYKWDAGKAHRTRVTVSFEAGNSSVSYWSVSIAAEPTCPGNLFASCNVFMVPHNVQHQAQAIMMHRNRDIVQKWAFCPETCTSWWKLSRANQNESGYQETLFPIFPDWQVKSSLLVLAVVLTMLQLLRFLCVYCNQRQAMYQQFWNQIDEH